MTLLLKFIFVIVSLLMISTANSQAPPWESWDSTQKANLEKDIQWMKQEINSLNAKAFLPVKNFFDAYIQDRGSSGKNVALKNSLSESIGPIELSIKSIDKFIETKDEERLCHYANSEIVEYKSSLLNFCVEMRLLDKIKPFDLSGYTINSFRNALYNVSQGRALLLTAMNNLQTYASLKLTADLLSKKAQSIKDTADSIKIDTDSIIITASKIKNDVVSIKKGLDTLQTEVPKIKKTTRLWGILGGFIGGVISGVLVALIQ